MPIFRRYLETLAPWVPTVLRRSATNLINLAHLVQFEAMDAVAEALEEFSDEWPIATAPGWLLDSHWLPYHNLQRNGLDDAEVRQFIHAKRLLNKSWGAGDQILDILAVLLPGAGLVFSYFAPKAWTVDITGVTMAEAAQALAFVRKNPSPQGGGFSAAGDNGMAIVADKEVLTFSSTYGAVDIAGWFSSVYGPSGSDEAGWAHVAKV